MLTLRGISKITLLMSLIILITAGNAFAKEQRGSKGRDKGGKQPPAAKQSQAAPDATSQNRGAAPQNPRGMQTAPARPQAIRQGSAVRQPNTVRQGGITQRNISPKINPNVSVRQPRTMTKTITPSTTATRTNVVSPRPVNRTVQTVTRTELKKTVQTIAPPTPTNQPVSLIKTEPAPIRRRTEVIGKPLTERRQSTPIETKPVTTPAKETSRNRAETRISPERTERPRPTEQAFTDSSRTRTGERTRTVKVTERTRTEETVQPQRQVKKVVAVDSRDSRRDERTGNRRNSSGDKRSEHRFDRPRASNTTTIVNDTSRRTGGLHGSHNINHDRIIDRPHVSKTIVIDGRSHERGDHNIHHDRRISGHRPGRIFSQVVWPSYRYTVCYNWGPRVAWRYVRPYYHRKYVFVSIGGWWPSYYSPARYYYYGYHPFVWYGCYPTAYEVTGDTYNYYTYNTYTNGQAYSTTVSGPLESVDETTFEDVRQRMAEQAAQEPEPETLADKFFEDGVKAFEEGDYETAAKAFADAVVLEPNDLILPFAYTQALFADEQYYEAAEILRLGLVSLPPDKEGIFFPRGLYADDEALLEQIEQLKEKTEIFPFDADFKFLLGYQYIGIGQYDQAQELLTEAAQYERNAEATEILLRLLEKIKETVETEV